MFDETGKTGPRAAQKAATGGAVLAAAREEFERVGFDEASVRSIAARAGVSAGTVLHHYADKRELLHAALFDDLAATLRDALARPGRGPLEAQLARLTRAVFAYYERRPKLSRTLLAHSLFADPPWAQRFASQTGSVHASIAGLVSRAVERGELRAEADPALFGVAYLSFFYFALISWAQGAHPTPASLVDRLVGQHLDGLRGAKPTRASGAKKSPPKRGSR